ncbi:MAG: hypothetical protein AAFO02_25200, partial [Bacteroidota bacterium]
DFLYALILLFFKEFSNVPMSTTWVFLGLLAGREIAIRYQLAQDERPEEDPDSLDRLGQVLNVALIAVIGYVIYLRDAVENSQILLFAILIAVRAGVLYLTSQRKQIDMKPTFRMVGSDLAKVTFGLVISIALVYIMKALTGVGGGF